MRIKALFVQLELHLWWNLIPMLEKSPRLSRLFHKLSVAWENNADRRYKIVQNRHKQIIGFACAGLTAGFLLGFILF